MKPICPIYMYGVQRSYGERSLEIITELLPHLKESGYRGVYLIACSRERMSWG